MSRWLLALVLAAAGSQSAQARDALAALDSCLAKLDRIVDTDYQRLVGRCPDLTPSLMQSEWAPWLPRGWNRVHADNLLSVDGLTELRTLLTRAAASGTAARTARVARLTPLLARLTEPDAPRGGWWARFKQWLREVLTPRPENADKGWLRRLFGDLSGSQALLEGIAWVSLALVVALAVAVILNELRLAGLLRSRQRASARVRAAAARPATRTLHDLQELVASQQPQLLLELVTTRLGEQDRLPPARALTITQVMQAARLPHESDRERLRVLAAVCERLRFSGREVAPQLLSSALEHGRELLAALETTRVHLPGAS